MGGVKPVDYLQAWSRIWPREYREQIQLVVEGGGGGGGGGVGFGELNPGRTDCKSSVLISDLSATLTTRWFTLTICFQVRSLVDISIVDWASFVPIHLFGKIFASRNFSFTVDFFPNRHLGTNIWVQLQQNYKLRWQNLREALQGKVSQLILTLISARVEFWYFLLTNYRSMRRDKKFSHR